MHQKIDLSLKFRLETSTLKEIPKLELAEGPASNFQHNTVSLLNKMMHANVGDRTANKMSEIIA